MAKVMVTKNSTKVQLFIDIYCTGRVNPAHYYGNNGKGWQPINHLDRAPKKQAQKAN